MSKYSFARVRCIRVSIETDAGIYAGSIDGEFAGNDGTRFVINDISIEPEHMNELLLRRAVYEIADAAFDEGARIITRQYCWLKTAWNLLRLINYASMQTRFAWCVNQMNRQR